MLSPRATEEEGGHSGDLKQEKCSRQNSLEDEMMVWSQIGGDSNVTIPGNGPGDHQPSITQHGFPDSFQMTGNSPWKFLYPSTGCPPEIPAQSTTRLNGIQSSFPGSYFPFIPEQPRNIATHSFTSSTPFVPFIPPQRNAFQTPSQIRRPSPYTHCGNR
jgi:hypothetical protein